MNTTLMGLEASNSLTPFDALSEEEDNCSICLNGYTAPIITECGHIFCRTCIEEWTKNGATCPIDRKVVDITKVKDHHFPEKKIILSFTNFFCDEEIKPLLVKTTTSIQALKNEIVDLINAQRKITKRAPLATKSLALLLLSKGEEFTRLSPQKKLQDYGLRPDKNYEITAICKLAKNGKIACDDCFDIAECEASCTHEEPQVEKEPIERENIPASAPPQEEPQPQAQPVEALIQALPQALEPAPLVEQPEVLPLPLQPAYAPLPFPLSIFSFLRRLCPSRQ